jgi:hypothetical protein
MGKMDSSIKLKLLQQIKSNIFNKGSIHDAEYAEEVARRWVRKA